jgi:uncharacterized protein (TIGR00251 family)
MKKEEARLTVRVRPNARQNRIQGFKEGVLYIRIASPPIEGKANRELADYLGEILGIAKSRISVIKGANSKLKLVHIDGLSLEQVTGVISGTDEV